MGTTVNMTVLKLITESMLKIQLSQQASLVYSTSQQI